MLDHLENFISIPLTIIRPDDIVPFDIFLFMEKNQKLILYRKRNQKFEANKIANFQKMNISNVYIRKEDNALYKQYTSQSITNILDDESIPEEEKQAYIKKAARDILDDVFLKQNEATDENREKNIHNVVKEIVTNVSREIKMGEIYDRLASMITDEENTFSHSLNVSTYAVLFSFALGITKSQDISNIGVASVLHDIYLASLPKELIDRYRRGEQLNTVEMLKIRKHPNGAENIIRMKYKKFNEQVIWIIRQHHEQPDGLGYPLGIKSENISLLAKILSLANIYDNIILQNRIKGITKAPHEVFEEMRRKWRRDNQIFEMDLFNELEREIFHPVDAS